MADNNEIKAINKTGFAQRLREYKKKAALTCFVYIGCTCSGNISACSGIFNCIYSCNGCSAYYTGAVCMGI